MLFFVELQAVKLGTLLVIEEIKINNKIDFAFADSNCSLAIKIKEGPIIHFNSKDELHSIINKY